jgi:HPt (histidine-containing phosphotransfer) domain-containing protein
MVNIPGNIEWVAELIPDLAVRIDQFVVDTEELDDELVEVFIEEIQRLTGELQQGLAKNDGEIIRMAAHSIKGMGGTMGLPELSVLGLEVENLVKEDRIPDARPLIEGLANWLTTFHQE